MASSDEPPTDMLQSFLEARYKDGTGLSPELIPGMIVWIMFGGFHTSSNTAAWACLELARHPKYQREVIDEIDSVYAEGGDLSFTALREMPVLEGFVSETLRLHPPLCTLMRQVVNEPFEYEGNVFEVGTNLVISPYVSPPTRGAFPRSRALRSPSAGSPPISSPTSPSAAGSGNASGTPSPTYR